MPKRTTTQQGYGWAWQKLRITAFTLYGRECFIQLPGCTRHADTIDHVDPLAVTGRHTVPTIDRVRPACTHCNSSRGATQGNLARKNRQPNTRLPTRHSREW